MLVLEERVDRLETVFERFLINMENLMFDMHRQADKDREQAE